MPHDKIIKAREEMRKSYGFYGKLLDVFDIHATGNDEQPVSTIAIYDNIIEYNPDFINDLEHDQIIFALAHVILLMIFKCNERRGDRDRLIWNSACNYSINNILVKQNIGRKTNECLLSDDYDDMIIEQIYEDLISKGFNYGQGKK